MFYIMSFPVRYDYSTKSELVMYVVISRSPERVRNPHLRAKLAETLEALVPIQKNSSELLSVSPVNMVYIKAKFFRLSHDVVTCDVDRDVSTAYC